MHRQYFKSYDVLKSFFADESLITVTATREFARELDVLIFAKERVGIPFELLSSLLTGLDSLAKLRRYVNAEPLAVSGFVVRNERSPEEVMFMEGLCDVLDRYRDKGPSERITLSSLILESGGSANGTVTYQRARLDIDISSLDQVLEKARFFVQPLEENAWIVLVVIRKMKDYQAVLDLFSGILGRNSLMDWRIEVVSIDQLPSPDQKREILNGFGAALREQFDLLGILGVSGKRDQELIPAKDFDAAKDLRTATLNRIYPLQEALHEVEREGAYTRGLHLVCTDQRAIYVIELKGKQRRVEVALLEKRDLEARPLSHIETAEQLAQLPNVYIEDDERIRIAMSSWIELMQVYRVLRSKVAG